MAYLNVGKIFERDFTSKINSYISKHYYLMRLDDSGTVKQNSVSDYLFFTPDKTFAVELKERHEKLYKSSLNINQVRKFLGFNSPEDNRISIYLFKRTDTKQMCIFTANQIKEMFANPEKTSLDADEGYKLDYKFNPQEFIELLEKLESEKHD
jgi:hypothetical protein